MWLTLALVYAVVAALATGVLLCVHARQLADEAADNRVPYPVVVVFATLLAPLLLPYAAAAVWWTRGAEKRRQEEMDAASRKHREYEFLPVQVEALPAQALAQFERHSQFFLELRYEHLGDYRLHPEPLAIHDRLFLSAEGDILAAVTSSARVRAVQFVSVLEDGTCVETSSFPQAYDRLAVEPADRLCMVHLPNAAVEELHHRHLGVLREIAARQQTGVMQFWSDQFRQVAIYHHRLLAQWWFRNGWLEEAPPQGDFRSLLGGVATLPPGLAEGIVARPRNG
jgi:hypothetical protein